MWGYANKTGKSRLPQKRNDKQTQLQLESLFVVILCDLYRADNQSPPPPLHSQQIPPSQSLTSWGTRQSVLLYIYAIISGMYVPGLIAFCSSANVNYGCRQKCKIPKVLDGLRLLHQPLTLSQTSNSCRIGYQEPNRFWLRFQIDFAFSFPQERLPFPHPHYLLLYISLYIYDRARKKKEKQYDIKEAATIRGRGQGQ